MKRMSFPCGTQSHSYPKATLHSTQIFSLTPNSIRVLPDPTHVGCQTQRESVLRLLLQSRQRCDCPVCLELRPVLFPGPDACSPCTQQPR